MKNVDIKKKLMGVHRGIINRCCEPKFRSYKFYGAKGVTICEEWRKSSKIFIKWALENGYKFIPDKNGRNTISIDRINPLLGYSPENCRWVDDATQRQNRTDIKLYEYNGQSKTLTQWCKELGLEYWATVRRIKKLKMSFEDAIQKEKFFLFDKNTKSKHHYIYDTKTNYSVQIKGKYYGSRKNLQDAIELRDNKLVELGMQDVLDKIKKYEKGCEDVKD